MAEGEFPKVDGDILYASEINGNLMPVGSIISWAKTLTGTPSLPSNWVECDGSTISDASSVYDGVTIPDLNGDNNFLRGSSTSGGTGGAATHTHTTSGGGQFSPGSAGTSAASNLPPYYEVVWIIRIK